MNARKFIMTCLAFLVASCVTAYGQEANRVQGSRDWRAVDPSVQTVAREQPQENEIAQQGSKRPGTRWGFASTNQPPETQFWPAQATAPGAASQAKAGQQSAPLITTWRPVREPAQPASGDSNQGIDAPSVSAGDASKKVHQGIRVDRESFGDPANASINGSMKRQPLHRVDPAIGPDAATEGFSNPFGESEFGRLPVFSSPSFSSGGGQAREKEQSPSSQNQARKKTLGSRSAALPTGSGTLTEDEGAR